MHVIRDFNRRKAPGNCVMRTAPESWPDQDEAALPGRSDPRLFDSSRTEPAELARDDPMRIVRRNAETEATKHKIRTIMHGLGMIGESAE